MNPWQGATQGLPAPLVAVDLDAFDANADDLVRRAAGRPIRVASKSVRCRALMDRVLARPGFAGIMAYAVREAIWLARLGADDVFVAYPSVDIGALRELAADPVLRDVITLTIDSVEHVRFIARAVGADAVGLRVAIDVDASLTWGPVHLGVRRSPIRTGGEAVLVTEGALREGLRVVGMMFYDAQIAGVRDTGPHIRLMKERSRAELHARRAAVVRALAGVVELEFVNGGGTGSLHLFNGTSAVTELAAGSGLYGPGLFDGYDDFQPRHAMAFGLDVVRRPAPGIVTAFAGGYAASGEAGVSRLPTIDTPGLSLFRIEGTGEVQSPMRGPATATLRLGDRVWLRHAKAGEALERFDEVHLVRDGELVTTVPSYRGEGKNFG